MNANLDRWKMRGAIDPPPMPHKKKEANRSGQLFLWGIIGVVIAIGAIGYLTSCADKTGLEGQATVGNAYTAPDINAVAEITDPNGEVTYSLGFIDIPEPVPGTYNIIVKTGIVTTEIVPDSPDGQMRICVRIDGSVESWIPIDDFNVPVIWTYDLYTLNIVVIDGRSSAETK